MVREFFLKKLKITKSSMAVAGGICGSISNLLPEHTRKSAKP